MDYEREKHAWGDIASLTTATHCIPLTAKWSDELEADTWCR